jgi:uroporphyrin-III C-methyltransferase
MEESNAPAAPASPAASPAENAPRRSRNALLAIVALALVAGLASFFWVDARHRIAVAQEEMARRLRDIETDSREARRSAHQAQQALREAQTKIAQLEAGLGESQGQQLALEAMYQDLSRNRDEWQLAEIEQVLAIASQQLQLAGNVRAALLALQLAEGRLAHSDRPQFMPVRRALVRDIERLKTLPTLDLGGMALKLDNLIATVDALPLPYNERAGRAADAKAVHEENGRSFWARLGAEVWGELKQLVVVRQMDSPEPQLLAPAESYFLRENLRLRLLNARLSLLSRDEAGFREDLRAAAAWIDRYFDPRSKTSADALAELKQLASATIAFEMPAITESLEAVRAFQSRRERGS